MSAVAASDLAGLAAHLRVVVVGNITRGYTATTTPPPPRLAAQLAVTSLLRGRLALHCCRPHLCRPSRPTFAEAGTTADGDAARSRSRRSLLLDSDDNVDVGPPSITAAAPPAAVSSSRAAFRRKRATRRLRAAARESTLAAHRAARAHFGAPPSWSPLILPLPPPPPRHVTASPVLFDPFAPVTAATSPAAAAVRRAVRRWAQRAMPSPWDWDALVAGDAVSDPAPTLALGTAAPHSDHTATSKKPAVAAAKQLTPHRAATILDLLADPAAIAGFLALPPHVDPFLSQPSPHVVTATSGALALARAVAAARPPTPRWVDEPAWQALARTFAHLPPVLLPLPPRQRRQPRTALTSAVANTKAPRRSSRRPLHPRPPIDRGAVLTAWLDRFSPALDRPVAPGEPAVLRALAVALSAPTTGVAEYDDDYDDDVFLDASRAAAAKAAVAEATTDAQQPLPSPTEPIVLPSDRLLALARIAGRRPEHLRRWLAGLEPLPQQRWPRGGRAGLSPLVAF